jgi:hypothetical protein
MARSDEGGPLTGCEVYNAVTDLATGPNVRWRDNLFQGLVILAFAGAGALWGLTHRKEKLLGMEPGGLLVGFGLLAGLVVGLVASGAFLMGFRAVRHARGRHG